MGSLQDLVRLVQSRQHPHSLARLFLRLGFKNPVISSQIDDDGFPEVVPGSFDGLWGSGSGGFVAVFYVVGDGDVGQGFVLAGQLKGEFGGILGGQGARVAGEIRYPYRLV